MTKSKKRQKKKKSLAVEQRKKRTDFSKTNYSLEFKMAMIEETKNMSNLEVERKYKLPHDTVSRFVRNKKAIQKAIDNGLSPETKKIKKSKFPELEIRLLHWFSAMRNRFVAVSGDLLKVCFNLYFILCLSF